MAWTGEITLHDSDVRLAVNEYVCAGTVNRNIRLLCENDEACKDLYEKVFGGIGITSYSRHADGYGYGTVVWYYDKDYSKPGHLGRRLWLLKCIETQNTKDPAPAFDQPNMYGQPDFEAQGWTDLNYHIDIFDPKFGLKTMILRRIQSSIQAHEADVERHRFGPISSDGTSKDFLGKKLLLKDLSNVDPVRTSGFFPYQTGYFTTDSIVNGTYRAWDCGLIEFDIVFRLGYAGQDQDGYDVLSCNDVRFQQSPVKTSSGKGYQENSKYFYSIDDMTMFQNAKTDEVFQSVVGNLKQGNRNGFVNTYFAKLDLFGQGIVLNGNPITEFADLNYAVFCSSSLAQVNASGPAGAGRSTSLGQGCNQMMWCDRTRTGITALLVTCPTESSADFGSAAGLAANSFSCSIVGRWKAA